MLLSQIEEAGDHQLVALNSLFGEINFLAKSMWTALQTNYYLLLA